jgi:hypothetical protein
MLALAIVPPWQNPDEPAHFTRTREHARAWAGVVPGPAADRDIVESMAQYDWWRYYERETPLDLPESPYLVSSSIGGPTSYYAALGAVLAVVPGGRLLTEFYLLRIVSALVALLTLWCAWRGARYLLDEPYALLVPAVVALHPQFLIVATSISPDIVLSCLGAVVWWQGMRLIVSPSAPTALLWLFAAGLAGPFVRRSGTPMLGMALTGWCASLLAAMTWGWREVGRLILGTIAVAAIAAAVLFAARSEIDRVVGYIAPILERLYYADSTWEYFKSFSVALFDHSWLLAGWARYAPSGEWMFAARVLTLVSVAGLAIVMCRRTGVAAGRRHLIAFTAVCFLIQLAAVYAWHFRLVSGPQGRYLFPAFVQFAALFAAGWLALWPERARREGALVLVSALFLLDVLGWATVLIPVYLS